LVSVETAIKRSLVGTVLEVAVHRVVAQIGGAAHKPARKWRVAVVTHLLRRCFPVDGLGFFSPKTVTVVNGSAIEICVCVVMLCPSVPLKLNS
jgi:hypothetical protein